MKIILLIIIAFLPVSMVSAQEGYTDSLKYVLQKSKNADITLKTLGSLSSYYDEIYPDSGIYYAGKMIDLAEKAGNANEKANGFLYKSQGYLSGTRYPEALQMAYNCLEAAEKLQEDKYLLIGRAYTQVGILNAYSGKDSSAKVNFQFAINLIPKANYQPEDLARLYCFLNSTPDSSIYYCKKAYRLFRLSNDKRSVGGLVYATLTGDYYRQWELHLHNKDTVEAQKYFDSASKYSSEGIRFCKVNNLIRSLARLYFLNTFHLYDPVHLKSSYQNARLLLEISEKYQNKFFVTMATGMLSKYYQDDAPNKDSAIKYLQATLNAKESMAEIDRNNQFMELTFKRQKELEDQQKKFQSQLKIYVLLGVILVILLVTFFLYRNNRSKQRDFNRLQAQKKETESQKSIAIAALEELKATQSLLIQSEKLASLGELTAGIAHEIQNPLNFVNNFSDLNTELIDELTEEAEKENIEEIKSIAKNIKDNEQKINHHGKRADSIVKGMLQHSRSSSGQKEPTGINALAEEYLRLAYHGLCAKDKLFIANYTTDLDPSAGKINIVPQEMGRAILNLLNNAFYAVDEKQKLNEIGYTPTVTLSTKKLNAKVEIKITDNGNGIPQKIVDKIFQPFFTTKPTGQGTGLGLSLAYDIVTKAHGGEIKVATKDNEGTEFIILLPA